MKIVGVYYQPEAAKTSSGYRPGEQEAIAAYLKVHGKRIEQEKAERSARALEIHADPKRSLRDSINESFREGTAKAKATAKERSRAWKEGIPSYLKVATKASVEARRIKADQRAKAMLAEFRALGGDVPDRLKRGAVMRILAERENITTTAIRDVLRRGYRLEGRKE